MHSFYRYGPPDPYTHPIFDRFRNDGIHFLFSGKMNRWNTFDGLIIKKREGNPRYQKTRRAVPFKGGEKRIGEAMDVIYLSCARFTFPKYFVL
jgi:hypothetical protein